MTKLNVISGFLGAGKTTLIKKLLDEALKGEKIVLIENEFGEIGIDGGFLKDAGVEISEMNSGCICCSLVGDFGKALGQVMEQFHPDRILIEPSGVGKLSDVIRAIQDVIAGEPEMVLGSAVTVADASKCKTYMKNFGEFYANQVQYAGAIVLSRTHTLTEEKLEEILTALDSGEYGAVLRAKGIVSSGSGLWYHFDYVPGDHQVRTGPADYTGRLCVIGSGLKEENLRTLFEV